MTNKTQTEKLLNFLRSGKSISPSQAQGMFGIYNPAARVKELREQGYCIYTNTSKNGVTQYKLGRANMSMVSSAYQAFGASIFSN